MQVIRCCDLICEREKSRRCMVYLCRLLVPCLTVQWNRHLRITRKFEICIQIITIHSDQYYIALFIILTSTFACGHVQRHHSSRTSHAQLTRQVQNIGRQTYSCYP
ncbi:hypothetical protein FOPG_04535 [Fusarium oxysporum f. sp. conglutinans race 2 54008]|uniref:Uncharacterized protein n=1 Tax=Fusarium oxysporum f. sp. conglutinans race 2 54008 TaxID=1089457 RepID=X0JCB2_FUSOX|nr:hypothetical protein FOPG_04535 [Fusarium oxysporum f. sp. conglutinans race 2 54008]